MKRILVIAVALTLLIGVGGWYYFVLSSRQAGHFDGQKLMFAVTSYKESIQRQSNKVPATVTLKELIDKGLLTESDVSAFSGMEVTINLAVDPKRPQDVMMRARLPDGQEIVTLADGSVQQLQK